MRLWVGGCSVAGDGVCVWVVAMGFAALLIKCDPNFPSLFWPIAMKE